MGQIMSHATQGIGRFFTKPGVPAYDQLAWHKRDAVVADAATGKVTFEQHDVEFPADWSDRAINAVAQSYFAGIPGTPDRESSLRQIIDRVVGAILHQGLQDGYFDTEAAAELFGEELRYILASQRASFGSDVWRRAGVAGRSQQVMGHTIVGLSDTARPMLDQYLRTCAASQHGLGIACTMHAADTKAADELSGFVRAADAVAAATHDTSAPVPVANLIIADADCPDASDFIWCKAIQRRQAAVLRAAGMLADDDGDRESGLYSHTAIRLTDEWMHAVQVSGTSGRSAARAGTGNTTRPTARELLRLAASAAWECGDPSVQFGTTINAWHTAPSAGHISGSDATGAYSFTNDSACGAATINLVKYVRDDGTFDVDGFKHTVTILSTALEILISYSAYPTDTIAKHTRAYRPLAVGISNLGALLAEQGAAYDSSEAQAQGAAITALLTGQVYAASARLAQTVGPFAGFLKDREATLGVLRMHRDAVRRIDAGLVAEELLSAAVGVWDEVAELSARYGVRNAQASALIADETAERMLDCAAMNIAPVTPGYSGHIRMMAAVQPFMSGGMSGPVVLPESTTIEAIEGLYIEAWRQGLKAISFYREGSAPRLPVTDTMQDARQEQATRPKTAIRSKSVTLVTKPHALPKCRSSKTYSFRVGDLPGAFTVGEYENGAPGELSITVGKQGSVLAGLCNALAIAISHGLQYGVPLKQYVYVLTSASFAPAGATDDEDIQCATSVTDYIFRRLALDYLSSATCLELGLVAGQGAPVQQAMPLDREQRDDAVYKASSAQCPTCGNGIHPSGDSYLCVACGAVQNRSNIHYE